jgi:hypothetical protein
VAPVAVEKPNAYDDGSTAPAAFTYTAWARYCPRLSQLSRRTSLQPDGAAIEAVAGRRAETAARITSPAVTAAGLETLSDDADAVVTAVDTDRIDGEAGGVPDEGPMLATELAATVRATTMPSTTPKESVRRREPRSMLLQHRAHPDSPESIDRGTSVVDCDADFGVCCDLAPRLSAA